MSLRRAVSFDSQTLPSLLMGMLPMRKKNLSDEHGMQVLFRQPVFISSGYIASEGVLPHVVVLFKIRCMCMWHVVWICFSMLMFVNLHLKLETERNLVSSLTVFHFETGFLTEPRTHQLG